jgi:hypothetical protein
MTVVILTGLALLWGSYTWASSITEAELDFTNMNGRASLAQHVPGSAFTLPLPSNVTSYPGFILPTATIHGVGGHDDFFDGYQWITGRDVDFYSFTGGGHLVLDIDDTAIYYGQVLHPEWKGGLSLSLFDSAGKLLAHAPFSGSYDLGGTSEAFVGTYLLPSFGTYYVAVAYGNAVGYCAAGGGAEYGLPHPQSSISTGGYNPDPLAQENLIGGYGCAGYTGIDPTDGNPRPPFWLVNYDPDSGWRVQPGPPESQQTHGADGDTRIEYTLHISLGNPDTPDSTVIPEPATLLLVGSGLAGLAARKKTRRVR